LAKQEKSFCERDLGLLRASDPQSYPQILWINFFGPDSWGLPLRPAQAKVLGCKKILGRKRVFNHSGCRLAHLAFVVCVDYRRRLDY
jgi:hypothetical protein